MPSELRYYQTRDGRRPFVHWLERLKDGQARTRIEARLARVAAGTLGDAEPVGEGVMELRIDWGPGYRVYFARVGQVIVLLLCGGDKKTQRRDIDRAKECLEDYKARATQGKSRGRA
jgi:putative addiction module killer protein